MNAVIRFRRVALAMTLAGGLIALWPEAGWAQASSVDAFYDALLPYGQWFELAPYGWVWRPDASEVGAGFVPYETGGYWAFTDLGWSFETDWPWEWAVFHYGRWILDETNGWVWIPDSAWAPSWVAWQYGGGFIGWAPLAPPDAVVEVAWIYVEASAFNGAWVEQHVLPRERYHQAAAVTRPLREETVRGTVHWYAGPARAEVERLSGKPVMTATMRSSPPPAGQIRAGELIRPTSRPPGPPPTRPNVPASTRAIPAMRPQGIRPAPAASAPKWSEPAAHKSH